MKDRTGQAPWYQKTRLGLRLRALSDKTGNEASFGELHPFRLKSARSPDTWLVTKGHILKPPFSVDCIIIDNDVEVTVMGANNTVTFLCNRVVVSKFRPGQIGFFRLNAENVVIERHALANFATAFQKILNAFPPNSRFNSEQLYAKITRLDGGAQAHARRRWKDLRFLFGFDARDFEDGHYARGASEVPIYDPQLRPDDNRLRQEYWSTLSDASKQNYGDSLPHCNLCDLRVASRVEVAEGATGFDDIGLLDHRRPVPQGGEDYVSNLQIACVTCNNKKNTICRACPYEYKCDSCFWAFPEDKRWTRLIIPLDASTAEALQKRLGRTDLEAAVTEVLKELAMS